MEIELQPHHIAQEMNISDAREIDARPTTESLESKIKQMPTEIQEKIRNAVLTTRPRDTFSFLKLYIYRYGLDHGPLLDLPYHPNYPFLTIIRLNPTHYRTFPEEAYLLLWYLSSVYTIGVFMNTRDIIKYIQRGGTRSPEPKYNILYKWLTLFHDIVWWKENIQAQRTQNVFVTFKMVTSQVSQGNGIRVERRYEAHVKKGYDDPFFYSMRTKLTRMKELLAVNGVDELTINPELLHNYSEWNDPETYPLSYIRDIQEILVRSNKSGPKTTNQPRSSSAQGS